MKSILVLATFSLYLFPAFAQAPQKMSYQAVIRNSSDVLVTNTPIGMQISILQGSASGTAVYVETQTPTTNANGLVSIEIGTGTVVSGNFATIDWTSGPYFIKTETDLNGGTNYTITGTSQLLSVPYALHAKTADTVTGGITETDPIFGASVASGITATDTTYWNNKLDSYTETDPVFGSSVASGITATDTANWNNKLDSYTETDPSVPTGTQIGQMQYWNGSVWVTVQPGSTGQTLTFVNGRPVWIGDTLSNVVANPATGKIWMDRNLGASQVATSSTDTNSYGDLYQWGRAADGHQIRTSGTTATLATSDTPGHGNFITIGSSPYDWRNPQNDNLWQGVSGTNNPCPSGFRIPTEAEWEAERTSWGSNNAAGAFASPLKLPVAGGRYSSDGSLGDVGSSGGYWSSTVVGIISRFLYFSSSNANIFSYYRANGFSVRCLKD